MAGTFAGQPGGARVTKLITLGTPHHGSPMANGPARDARAGATWGPTLALFDSLFFSQTGPGTFEVNRSDLRWDTMMRSSTTPASPVKATRGSWA